MISLNIDGLTTAKEDGLNRVWMNSEAVHAEEGQGKADIVALGLGRSTPNT